MTGQAHLSTIIASQPGIAEQSLWATLEALPSVKVVGRAAGCLSALHLVHELQADLIVIDSNLPIAEVEALLRQINQERRPIFSLVLAATRDQVRRALAAGADAALRRDVSLMQLGAVVAGLRRGGPLEPEAPGGKVPAGE